MSEVTQMSQMPLELTTPANASQTLNALGTYRWPGANGTPTSGFDEWKGSVQNTGANPCVMTPQVSNDGVTWDDLESVTIAAGLTDGFTTNIKWAFVRLTVTSTLGTDVVASSQLIPVGMGTIDSADLSTIIADLAAIKTAVELIDDSIYTEDATVGAAGAAVGQLVGGAYEQVPNQVEDRDFKQFLIDSFGRKIIAGFNSALGSIQSVEQAPPIYDNFPGLWVASAALPGAGAYTSWVEIPTGGRGRVTILPKVTRGAAGGSVRMQVEGIITESGTDYQAKPTYINAGAFAAGADVNSSGQGEDWLMTPVGAAAEGFFFVFDMGSVQKLRLRLAEVGVVGTPSTVAVVYMLHNR